METKRRSLVGGSLLGGLLFLAIGELNSQTIIGQPDLIAEEKLLSGQSSATGYRAVSIGSESQVLSWKSVAIGYQNVASYTYSFAFGSQNLASDWGAVALGWSTQATDPYTTSMGGITVASGWGSTAIGWRTAASGMISTSMGGDTVARGDYSTALGYSTTAQSFGSVVLGQFNVISGNAVGWTGTDPLFVIGNGSSSANRSNALTILKNGNVGIETTSPAKKLHVNGDVKIDGELVVQKVPPQGGISMGIFTAQ